MGANIEGVSSITYNEEHLNARVPIADWQAEQTRLTVFPTPDAATRSTDWMKADWWQTVTNNSPDEITTNPKRGSGLIQGALDPGKLMLRLEPQRIDWIYVPSEHEAGKLAAARELPALGPGMEMITAFSAIVEKWLRQDDLPPVARMAFGAVLMHEETDRKAAYLRLPDYVPVRVDPESSDFFYQINLPPVPSSTGIQGLRLNRLSRWNVINFKLLALDVTSAPVQAQSASEVFALRIEVDINTAPTLTKEIPRERLVSDKIMLWRQSDNVPFEQSRNVLLTAPS